MRQSRFWFVMGGTLGTLALACLLPIEAGAASRYKILHEFKGQDGAGPVAGLVFDAGGNLYGTTASGGKSPICGGFGCGTAFKLTPNSDGSWTEKVIYDFCSLTNCLDGAGPSTSLIFDTSGNLYGTTNAVNSEQSGVVFQLTPNSDGSWTEKVLHTFTGGADGSLPSGGLIFDAAGNLYGTTELGGANNAGLVFMLTPNSDGSWTESVLHSFTGDPDGAFPAAGLIFDSTGSLYGTTAGGGTGNGTAFKLSANSDANWTERVFYRFKGGKGGSGPVAGLVFDTAGSLYGTAAFGGSNWGVVFKLTPSSNGSWRESVLHTFEDRPGACPNAGLIRGTTGNLYGTTGNNCNQASGFGAVYGLAPKSGGGWVYSILHAFQGKPAGNPFGSLVLDQAGNLYGTAAGCGSGYNCRGVVFEITP